MESQVQEAITIIEKNNWVETLRQCSSLGERLDKLMELLPGIPWWSLSPVRQLVFYLYQKYGLDFGVCPFYKMEEGKQYCTASGEKVECFCAIPEIYCVHRDTDGKPKYPELLFHWKV